MELDHIAIASGTLSEAAAFTEARLGVALQAGGAHDVFFTHNKLLGLEDGLYLEAIAIDPMAPKPERPRWFDLDRFQGSPRLTNWICRCDDLDATLARLPEGMGDPVQLQRGDLRWRMAVPETGILPFDNCAPALIQWQTAPHPAQKLLRSHIRLTRLVVQHPRIQELAEVLSGQISDPRIVFAVGPAGLLADFDTPLGQRSISA